MKRKFISFITLFLAVLCSALCFVACGNAEPVAITAPQTVEEGTTLLALMEEQKTAGELDFEMKDGLIIEINGTKNTTNSFWMLYTTDEENANTDWGTFEWNGETLGSAVLGADTLVVAQGETYVWVYEKF